MHMGKSVCLALALGGMLLLGQSARAITVTYTTLGTFDSGDAAGTSSYVDAANGITIDFLNALGESVDVPPPSQTSFGTFDTSATTTTSFAPVSSGFTLDIFQTAPAPGGTLTFVGTLSGQLRVNNSQAFVQFDAPLTQSIGLVIYSIVSADDNTPGRVNIAPPTTNNGLTTVAGRINVIPEPSAIVLVGLGAVAPLGLMLRGRRKV